MAYDGSIKIDTKIDTSGFGSGIDKMKSMASKGVSAMTATFAAVSTAIVAGGTAAVSVGSEFEAAISRVSAISGATEKELETLKNQAVELGAETAFSAKEAAEGMENLASAGFTVTEITKAMPGMLDLAASSGEDLATASDIAASTLRGFGLAASEASHVADVLAKNAADTNAAVADTGEAMQYIAPLAKSAGISLEETAAAIGIMADNGIKGSQAGTTLRGALSRLSKPTKSMREVMAELNLEFYDSDGKMKSLSEQTKMLKEATKNMTDEQRNQAMVTLYGQEALSGMLALMNSEEGRLESLTKSYKSCDGAASEMATTMQDNLKSKIEEFGGSLETLGITIYEDLQEPLKSAAEEGIEYVNQLTTAFQKKGLTGLIEEAGNIFGELAVKAAEAAPKMVNAAIGFIQSFVDGIAANSSKLITAARMILNTIVDSLVKFLPSEVQKPIKEFVNTIVKSFETGGLKKAINTIKNVLSNLGKVASNLAKTILPPLAKIIDTVADNLDTLLPLAVSVYSAYKSWKILSTITALFTAHTAAVTAESLAEAASLGTITLKQIAVGALTGEITLATAAQYAWNAAMNANPIGIIITAVAALVAGLAVLNLTQEEEISSADRLIESQNAMAEGYNNVFESANEYIEGISQSSDVLDGFNDSIILSNEKQQELADKMNEIQTEITEIAKSAKEERTQLTEEEIQRLDDLFKKQKELADQQLQIQQEYQGVVKDMANDLAENHDLSLEEYEAYAQEYTATAEQTREDTVKAAADQRTNWLAEKRALIGTDEQYTQDWYDEQRKQANKDYEAAVDEANKLCADTLNILQKGYYDRSDALQDYAENQSDYNYRVERENTRHAERLTQLEKEKQEAINEELASGGNDSLLVAEYYDKLIWEENKNHNDSLSYLNEQFSNEFSEEQQDQLGTWMAMVAQAELYGGELTDEEFQMVQNIIKQLDVLPEESKTIMTDTMQGMVDGVKEKQSELYAEAVNTANTFLGLLRTVFDTHSPSRKTKQILSDVIEGGEVGVDKEAPNLYKQADDVASTFTKRMQAGISADGLISKMKSAVSAGRAFVAQKLTANVIHDVNLSTDDNNKKVVLKGDVVTHIDIDGRETAVVLTPFISEELAWEDR